MICKMCGKTINDNDTYDIVINKRAYIVPQFYNIGLQEYTVCTDCYWKIIAKINNCEEYICPS